LRPYLMLKKRQLAFATKNSDFSLLDLFRVNPTLNTTILMYLLHFILMGVICQPVSQAFGP